MLKVILKYTDCCQDGRHVFSTLAANNIRILKTKCMIGSIEPKITILIDGYDKLNQLLFELNQSCSYEVRVVKVKNVKFTTQND